MKRSTIFLGACATAIAIGAGAAFAQPDWPDPDAYYSQTDHTGFYDHNGRYHQFDSQHPWPGDMDSNDRAPPPDDRRPPPDARDNQDDAPPPGYYREGDYERDCHRGNAAAGTVFGAAGGGLIGGVASHGNPAAIVGGVLLGGLFGNAISRDIDCDDQRYAFDTYATGLNGDVGRRYDWSHGDSHGYFTPTREYYDDGLRCRDFTSVTFRHGEEYDHNGAACYQRDGTWHVR